MITGEWTEIKSRDYALGRYVGCSVCRHPVVTIVTGGHLEGCNDPSGEVGGYWKRETEIFYSDFCPFCGAKMKKRKATH